jgi:hypothetical protein
LKRQELRNGQSITSSFHLGIALLSVAEILEIIFSPFLKNHGGESGNVFHGLVNIEKCFIIAGGLQMYFNKDYLKTVESYIMIKYHLTMRNHLPMDNGISYFITHDIIVYFTWDSFFLFLPLVFVVLFIIFNYAKYKFRIDFGAFSDKSSWYLSLGIFILISSLITHYDIKSFTLGPVTVYLRKVDETAISIFTASLCFMEFFDYCFKPDMTLKQKDFMIKSLSNSDRMKAINEYCAKLGKSWNDLTKKEASGLINILVKIP